MPLLKKPFKFFFVLFFILFFFLSCAGLFASDGYVMDKVGLLPDTKRQDMARLSGALEAKTGIQVVTLVVNDLGGVPIQEYAARFFSQKGLGQKQENNGVLLVLALKERKVRIEVGYGLEGLLPDGKVGALLDATVLPEFKSGSIARGVYQGHVALVSLLAKEKQVVLDVKAPALPKPSSPPVLLFLVIGLALFFLSLKMGINPLFLLFFMGGDQRRDFGSFGGDGFGGFGGGLSGGGGADRSF